MLPIVPSAHQVVAVRIPRTLTGGGYGARIADPLLPHVEVRPFEPGRRGAAMAWVSEV